MTGAGGGPEGRQLARMANARGLSGLRLLPEMLTWPGVIGADREPEGRLLARMADARDVSGAHRLPEMRPLPRVIGAGREPEVVCWRGWQTPEIVRASSVAGSAAMAGSDRIGAGGQSEVACWRDWWWHEVGSGCGGRIAGKRLERGVRPKAALSAALSAPGWARMRKPKVCRTYLIAGSPVLGGWLCRRMRHRLSAVRHVMLFDQRQAFETKILLGDSDPVLMEMMRHFALRSAVLRLSLRPLNRSGGPENER